MDLRAVPQRPKEPAPAPSKEEVSEAIRILSNHLLHYYQLLYFNGGLVGPGYSKSTPLRLSRRVVGNMLTAVLEVRSNRDESLTFAILPGMLDEDVLHKAQLLAHVAGKEKKHPLDCCAFATPVNCVCIRSTDCPIHGRICHGTHD